MSDTSAIVAALEGGLKGISSSFKTAWEGQAFEPVVGTPDQRVSFIWAAPLNTEFGPGFNERGVFQVDLHYPPELGAKPARVRGDLIRSTFRRGTSFSKSDLVVTIMKTPAFLPAHSDADGRYVLPVSIEFQASLQS